MIAHAPAAVSETAVVRLPGLGRRRVGLRAISAEERRTYYRVAPALRSAWLVVHALVLEADGEGARLTDADVPMVADWPAAIVEPIAARARAINALEEDAVAQATAALQDDAEERFAFRMALALGYPHPDHLRPLLTSRQWAECLAYAALEPFGAVRDDYRAGMDLALHANLNRNPKKRPQPFEVWDFFPGLKPPVDPEVREQQLRDLLFRDMPLRVAAARSVKDGAAVNLAEVPDIFLTPADRAAKAAQGGGA